jgi:heat shock protein HslJ
MIFAMRALVIAVGVAAMFAVSGCKASGNTQNQGDRVTMSNLAGDWTLRQIRGADVSSMLPAGARAPTLTFASDGHVSGFAGVNRASGSLDTAALDQGRFTLSPMAVTKMAGLPQAMALEDKFLGSLNEVNAARIQGDTLTLSKGNTPLLQFTRGH